MFLGKRVDSWAQAIADRLHAAQQAAAMGFADAAAAQELHQLRAALKEQHVDVVMEVLHHHQAFLSADGYLDPVFFSASIHIFGGGIILHEFARRNGGRVHITAQCSATASAIAQHLYETLTLRHVVCDGMRTGQHDNHVVEINGALSHICSALHMSTAGTRLMKCMHLCVPLHVFVLMCYGCTRLVQRLLHRHCADSRHDGAGAMILQAVAHASHVTALDLNGQCWAVTEKCRRALAQCTQLERLHLQQPNTAEYPAGCISVLSELSNLTQLKLGSLWCDVPKKADFDEATHEGLGVPEATPQLQLRLPKLRRLQTPALPASTSLLPSLQHLKSAFRDDIESEWDSMWLGERYNLTDATPSFEAKVQIYEATARHPLTSLRLGGPCFSELRALIAHGKPARPLKRAHRELQESDVPLLASRCADGDESLLTTFRHQREWMAQLQRIEFHSDSILLSCVAARRFLAGIRHLQHLSLLLMPGIFFRVQRGSGVGSSGVGGSGDGGAYEAFLGVLCASHTAEQPDTAGMLRVQQAFSALPALEHLCFVQPASLACERDMPRVAERVAVYSMTQQALWRQAWPEGWPALETF